MVELVTLKTKTAVVSESTVAVLRAFLEMAEAGEIVSTAIAAVEPGGGSRTQCSSTDHFQALLGATLILQDVMLASRRGA